MPKSAIHQFYRINPVVKLHWAAWRDQYVVFDETSGQTHLLDADNALVLDFLADRMVRFDVLVKELALASIIFRDSKVADWLTSVLYEFQKSGLVEVTEQ